MAKGKIRGEQIKDETIASADIASGSIKAGEMNAQAISSQALITSIDATDDRLLVWDDTDVSLKQVAPENLFGEISTVGADVNFYVSGSAGSQGTTTRGTGVFGGDLVVSGGIDCTGNLYVADSAGMYTDKIRRYSDSDNTTKILLNDELIKLYAGHSSDDIVRVGDTNLGDDNNFWVSGSVGSRTTSTRGTAVFDGDLVVSGGLAVDGSTLAVDEAKSLVGIGTDSPRVKLDVMHDPTSLSDDTGGGEVVTFGGEDGTDTLAAGKLMFLHSGGDWKYADADAAATSGGVLLAIALGSAVTDGLLIRGFFDAATIEGSFVKGAACYVSEEAGTIDFTAPSGVDDVVRVVGYGTDTANVIYFNPSSTWIELE